MPMARPGAMGDYGGYCNKGDPPGAPLRVLGTYPHEKTEPHIT
jgi:hypothetical protein